MKIRFLEMAMEKSIKISMAIKSSMPPASLSFKTSCVAELQGLLMAKSIKISIKIKMAGVWLGKVESLGTSYMI
ncbi:MAG: hypothetical protein R2828_03630 [Saprospiraceae bacterium]